jgi:hypothetical protein
MRCLLIRAVPTIFIVAAALVVSSTADAASSWARPSILGPTGRESGAPQIAVTPTGEAIAVWEGLKPQAIEVSTRKPGGGWTRPVALGPSQESEPQIAVSAGKAVVVWSATLQAHGYESSVVLAATRIAGRPWGKARNISKERHRREEPEGREPKVAITPAGKAIAIWQAGDEDHSTTSFIRSATQAATGTAWSAPIGLPGSIEGENAEVGTTRSGETVAIWSASYDEESGLEVASRPAHGKWKSSERLDRPGSYATPQLTVTATGEAIGVWTQQSEEEGGSVLQVATRSPGGKWKVKALAPDGYSESPAIVTEPGGRARLVWILGPPSGEGGQVVSSVHSPGGGWTTPVSLVSEGLQLPAHTRPRIVVDAAGGSTAAWETKGPLGEATIQAASRPAGGSWSVPIGLVASPPAKLYGEADVQLVTAPGGEVLGIWHSFTGSGWVIEAASRPPVGFG